MLEKLCSPHAQIQAQMILCSKDNNLPLPELWLGTLTTLTGLASCWMDSMTNKVKLLIHYKRVVIHNTTLQILTASVIELGND